MQRLTLILPIADRQSGNIMAAVVSGNPDNLNTFDNAMLTTTNDPTTPTHVWQSTGVDDEQRARLALSLAAFPDAIFVFHSNDEAMLVESSNFEPIMAMAGQSLSPMEAIALIGLAPFQVVGGE